MKMTEIQSSFEDILEPRRREASNFMWISRELNTVIAYKQLKKPTPKWHKMEVLHSPKMQEIIEKISNEEHISKEEVQQKIHLILNEIGYNKRLSIIRWLGLILTKITLKVCSGIFINFEHILKLKHLMGNIPVVFIPSHRSYADFILMSFICFTYDIEIPAIAAGMDFHGMWGMGTVLRDTGAFFMRRIYNKDYLYWDTFRQYINQLVTKGDLPIEFFIEGTRSRTGKSLKPKFGFLSMILKSFFVSQVPDILFVPINISYDRVLEEKLFAFELLGVPKPKESTSGFFKSLSIVNEQFGNIYVDFAKPISAREYFNSDIIRSIHSIKPLHMQEMTPCEKELTASLAHDIVYAQQKSCVITTFNLMALSLTDSFISGKVPIKFEDFVNDVNKLQHILKVCGGKTDMRNSLEDISAALRVHRNLVKIDNNMTVDLIQPVIVCNLNTHKLKGYAFSQETMTFAVPHVMLQIYVNPLLHYIFDAAFIYIILKCKGNMYKDTLFGHYSFLRLLFAFEFITTAKRYYLDFESALNYLQEVNLVELDSEKYSLSYNDSTVFSSILQPFMLAYYVICNTLFKPLQEHNEQSIILSAQYQLEKIIKMSKQFVHPYCLCLDVLKNCLLSLASMDVIKRINRSGKTFCCANRSISDVIDHLECLLCTEVPKMELKYEERNFFIESKL